jgi:uncharacterized protein YjbI with pentapeptide repeats
LEVAQLLELYGQGHRNFANIDLSNAELRNVSLTGIDLRGSTLNKADLSSANLIEANLIESDFTGAILKGSNLRGTNLRGAILQNLTACEDTEFTGVRNLDERTRLYLCTIACGMHPFTKNNSRQTLDCLN